MSSLGKQSHFDHNKSFIDRGRANSTTLRINSHIVLEIELSWSKNTPHYFPRNKFP